MTPPAFAAAAPLLPGQRAFLGGAAPSPAAPVPRGAARTSAPTAQFKLPGLPKLGGGKKKGAAAAKKAPAKPVTIKTGAVSAEAMKAPSAPRTASAVVEASAGVKFYNPKTAAYNFRADSKGHGATAFDSRAGVASAAAGTNARANENGTFRNMNPYTDNPVWARPNWSPEDADVAVRTVFRNVLGNAYVVDEEVAELAAEISCFKETRQAKEFVRAVALSTAYKSRYFEPMSNMRFVELNFKHFLGRAPWNQEEISEHIQILVNEGYNAEINSYLDSDEYDTLWGDERIPQPNFRGGHDFNIGMNTLAVLRGGWSRSDRVQTSAFFPAASAMPACGAPSILKGLPEAWRSENAARDTAGTIREFPTSFWNPEEKTGGDDGGADWKARMGVNSVNWYAKSIVYKDVMKPVLKHSQEEEEAAAAALKWGSTMAKNYVGTRYTWNVAPVIEIKSPSSEEAMNGVVSLAMKEIEFSIPSDLSQKV